MLYFAGRRGTAANAEPNAVLTWPEGNNWLVKKLEEKIAGAIHTKAAVTRIDDEGSKITVEYWDDLAKETHHIDAEYVIWAAPRFIASHVIPALGHSKPSQQSSPMTYSPWLVANITLSKEGLESLEGEGVPLSWDNVNMLSPSLGYVVATHQNVATYTTKTVISYYYPLSGHPAKQAREIAYKRSDKEWQDIVLADLEKTHPGISTSIEEMTLCVWGHGMITPTPGYLWGPFRQSLQQPVGRIHFAHSDMSGISNFEEAQYQGINTANRILKRFAS